MDMKTVFATLGLIFFFLTGFSQGENKLLRQGNNLYDAGKFKDAEMKYRKAIEVNKESPKGQFNLGAATYKEKNYEESSRIYGELAGKDLDKKTKAKIYHNLGNSLLEAKQYDKSILAYKNSLLNVPSDKDTKYNLEYAKMMLQKQQQQQQQKQKDQQKKDEDKKDKKDQQNDQNKDSKENKKQPQDQKKISKEDAERMLEALKNNEKKTMQKVEKQRAKVQTGVIEKDW